MWKEGWMYAYKKSLVNRFVGGWNTYFDWIGLRLECFHKASSTRNGLGIKANFLYV
jgi:hypothetical protein